MFNGFTLAISRTRRVEDFLLFADVGKEQLKRKAMTSIRHCLR
jgi:hypothetical protein